MSRLSPEKLIRKAEAGARVLQSCRLCGRLCGVNRLDGETGFCQAGSKVKVAAALLHYGEEPPISGTRGSGTIFFSGCPLACVFCQNYQISREGLGQDLSEADLAGLMLDLQNQGAHNINLVSPTPWVPQILRALSLAVDQGLDLPLVYNTGGYDAPAALSLMDGVVDIYLPDAKFDSPAEADRYAAAPNYPRVNRTALRIMHRQVGRLEFEPDGLARGGLLVRLLVLPGAVEAAGRILKRLVDDFGAETWFSLMAQYAPPRRFPGVERFPELTRPLSASDYEEAVDAAWDLGLENVFIQELEASEIYVPDFTKEVVFKKTE